jgi:uncharacterized OB-fold protein
MSTTLLPQKKRIDTGTPTGGAVYTETVIFSPPEAFVKDAPYQIAIIDLEDGGRLTARIDGENVSIGDRVDFAGFRNGIPFFRKRT